MLRTVIDGVGLDRRHFQRRDALEAEAQILRVRPVQRLTANPILLLVAVGAQIEPAELALAAGPYHQRIINLGDDRPGFAARPFHIGLAGAGGLRRDDQCRIVLLRAIEAVGKLVVHRDLVDFGRGLVGLYRPGAATIARHVGAAIIGLHDQLAVLRVDPHIVVVAVRGGLVLEALAAIGGAEPVLVADEQLVGVVGVDAQRGVIEGPRGQLAVAVDQCPGLAAILGAIEASARLGFDQRIEPVGRRRAHANVGAAEQASRQAARKLGPGVTAIDGLVEAAILAARGDCPRPANAVPHRGIERLGIIGGHFQIGRAKRLVDEQHLRPGLAAVAGAIDAAILAIGKGVAGAGHEHFIRVGRVDADGGNLADIAQADERPGLGAVHRFPDAAPDRDVAANLG